MGEVRIFGDKTTTLPASLFFTVHSVDGTNLLPEEDLLVKFSL